MYVLFLQLHRCTRNLYSSLSFSFMSTIPFFHLVCMLIKFVIHWVYYNIILEKQINGDNRYKKKHIIALETSSGNIFLNISIKLQQWELSTNWYLIFQMICVETRSWTCCDLFMFIFGYLFMCNIESATTKVLTSLTSSFQSEMCFSRLYRCHFNAALTAGPSGFLSRRRSAWLK